MAEYKVLLTASGLGSRLGNLTNYTNKSLIRIGELPAISYIVENYPEDVPIVITLGHYGDHVKSFLELAYPDRIFEFVDIDRYEGEGSSLGYSMLQAKHLLQCPFVFHACDTIVQEYTPLPSCNWMAGVKLPDSSQYRTLQHNNWKISKINDKGELQYDYVYVGLAGIHDYQAFWNALEEVYQSNPKDSSLSDCHAFDKMVGDITLHPLETWYDIGNANSLKHARRELGGDFQILDKVDENIFIFDDFVIKFFHSKTICQNRVKRVQYLNGTTPALLGWSDNFYKYEKARGVLLSETLTPGNTLSFLTQINEELWSHSQTDNEFAKTCHKFYITKSRERINKYITENNLEKDSWTYINNVYVPPAEELINILEKRDIYPSVKTLFHGDFILDNIIDTNTGIKLIDWRQDFAGELEYGDVYYDLAKLNHNLTFNHDIVNRKLYTVQEYFGRVEVDILVSKRLLDCQEVFHTFIKELGYDLQRVKLLTAVIWINMAPLHEYPLSKFLFNFGRYHLYRALNEK